MDIISEGGRTVKGEENCLVSAWKKIDRTVTAIQFHPLYGYEETKEEMLCFGPC